MLPGSAGGGFGIAAVGVGNRISGFVCPYIIERDSPKVLKTLFIGTEVVAVPTILTKEVLILRAGRFWLEEIVRFPLLLKEFPW